MARSKHGGLEFDFRPLVEEMGLEKVIEQIGRKKVIEQFGTKELIEQVGIEAFLANLTPAQRRELERRMSPESERKKS